MGSVIDGEDVVQDTFARALVALDQLQEVPPMRAWLFRIAHNRALDLLRSRAIRAAEPIEAAQEVADPESPDPLKKFLSRPPAQPHPPPIRPPPTRPTTFGQFHQHHRQMPRD